MKFEQFSDAIDLIVEKTNLEDGDATDLVFELTKIFNLRPEETPKDFAKKAIHILGLDEIE